MRGRQRTAQSSSGLTSRVFGVGSGAGAQVTDLGGVLEHAQPDPGLCVPCLPPRHDCGGGRAGSSQPVPVGGQGAVSPCRRGRGSRAPAYRHGNKNSCYGRWCALVFQAGPTWTACRSGSVRPPPALPRSRDRWLCGPRVGVLLVLPVGERVAGDRRAAKGAMGLGMQRETVGAQGGACRRARR